MLPSAATNETNVKRSFPPWKKKFSTEEKKVNSCYLAERENGDWRKMVLPRMGRGTVSCSEGWRWQEAAERDKERDGESMRGWVLTAEPWGQLCQEVERTRNLWRMGKRIAEGRREREREEANVQLGSWYELNSCRRTAKTQWNVFHRCYREPRDPVLLLDSVLTLAEAGATDPAAVMPRLTAMSPLDVVTATVTGVGRRDGMTGRGRSPGRLLPLTTAEAQLWLAPPLWRPVGRMSLRSQGPR